MRLSLSYDQLCAFLEILMKTHTCRFESESVKQFSTAILKPFAAKLLRLRFPVKAKTTVTLTIAECQALKHVFRTVNRSNEYELLFITQYQEQIEKVCLLNI